MQRSVCSSVAQPTPNSANMEQGKELLKIHNLERWQTIPWACVPWTMVRAAHETLTQRVAAVQLHHSANLSSLQKISGGRSQAASELVRYHHLLTIVLQILGTIPSAVHGIEHRKSHPWSTSSQASGATLPRYHADASGPLTNSHKVRRPAAPLHCLNVSLGCGTPAPGYQNAGCG
jgi:hypothetical protein